MAILIFILGMLSPRILLFFMWLFSYDKFEIAYSSFIVPFLGFLFLPFTTIMYVFTYSPATGVSGWGWLMMFLAILIDLGSYVGGLRRK